MPKNLTKIAAVASSLFAPIAVVLAETATAAPTPDVSKVATGVVNIIYYILITVAVIFIILGAIQFLTAGGDPEKVSEARNKIIYAIIAVVIGIAANGILALVKTTLGG